LCKTTHRMPFCSFMELTSGEFDLKGKILEIIEIMFKLSKDSR